MTTAGDPSPGNEVSDIHDTILQSLVTCDVDIRKLLYSSVVLSNGAITFQGTGERMTIELTALAPSIAKIKVVAPLEHKYSVWIGTPSYPPSAFFPATCGSPRVSTTSAAPSSCKRF